MYRAGNYVDISKLESTYCLVAVLRRYVQAAGIDLSSHLPLFRPLTKKKLRYIPLRIANYLIPVVGDIQGRYKRCRL